MWARCVIFLRVFFLCGLTEADDHGKPSDFLKQVKLAMEQNALTFAAEYTGEVFGNFSGGSKSGATYEEPLASPRSAMMLSKMAESFIPAMKLL